MVHISIEVNGAKSDKAAKCSEALDRSVLKPSLYDITSHVLLARKRANKLAFFFQIATG